MLIRSVYRDHLSIVKYSHGAELSTGDVDHHLILQAAADPARGGLVGRWTRAHLSGVIVAPGVHLWKTREETDLDLVEDQFNKIP